MKLLNNCLAWIDLEMTGLDPLKDSIIEVALVITDNNLKIIAQGPSYSIYQPNGVLERMSLWSKEQHTKSGLLDQVRRSKKTIAIAEKELEAFLQKYAEKGTILLAGNSVWQDALFLCHHMQRVKNLLHYRIIDVTTFKEMLTRWYPDSPHLPFVKEDKHRALDDIYESIKELEHYRKHFFL